MTTQTTQQALPDRHLERGHRPLDGRVRGSLPGGDLPGHVLRLRRSPQRRRPAAGRPRSAASRSRTPTWRPTSRAPDFFDAERFPQLSFEAREISRSGDDLTIAGELTLKGHTEAVEIKGHITDPAPDPYGGERFGLQLETTVDRTKFGLNWNNPLPSGDPALANDVTIIVDLQLVKES